MCSVVVSSLDKQRLPVIIRYSCCTIIIHCFLIGAGLKDRINLRRPLGAQL